MEPEVSQTDSALRLWAWVLDNQKKLLQGGLILGLAAFGVYAYFHYQQATEITASHALSEVLPARLRETPAPADLAKSYLALAEQYTGTRAASYASLRAATALFTSGKYTEAQAQYESFLRNDPSSPFTAQAAYGIAASLDAAGKTTEAQAKYDEVVKRYSTDGVAEEARMAMASLYGVQGKPEMAYKLYDEILQTTRGSASGQEAFMKREELAQQYPYLRTNTPPPKPLVTSAPAAVTNVMHSVATASNSLAASASNLVAKLTNSLSKTVSAITNRSTPSGTATPVPVPKP